MKKYYFGDWSQGWGSEGNSIASAYIIDAETELAVDTVYQDVLTREVWTHTGKALSEYGL